MHGRPLSQVDITDLLENVEYVTQRRAELASTAPHGRDEIAPEHVVVTRTRGTDTSLEVRVYADRSVNVVATSPTRFTIMLDPETPIGALLALIAQ